MVVCTVLASPSFSNIKSAMDTAEESLVLPAVPGSLVKSLGGNVVTMTAADLENGAAAATAALKGDKGLFINNFTQPILKQLHDTLGNSRTRQ